MERKIKLDFTELPMALTECIDWNEKARVRKLVTKEEYDPIFNELQKLPKSINSLIKYTNDKLAI